MCKVHVVQGLVGGGIFIYLCTILCLGMTTLCVRDRDGGLPRGIASITSDNEFDNNIVNPVFICIAYEKT